MILIKSGEYNTKTVKAEGSKIKLCLQGLKLLSETKSGT